MRNLQFVFTVFLRIQNELVSKLCIGSHQKNYFDPNPFSISAGSSTTSSTNKVLLQKRSVMLSGESELDVKGIKESL